MENVFIPMTEKELLIAGWWRNSQSTTNDVEQTKIFERGSFNSVLFDKIKDVKSQKL